LRAQLVADKWETFSGQRTRGRAHSLEGNPKIQNPLDKLGALSLPKVVSRVEWSKRQIPGGILKH